jgi:lipopolysaccharide/colanic/teichoic acid biosynthesis glycosyltransferase
MAKWIFDRLASLLGILVLSPILLIAAIAVIADSRGGAFFVQTRTGKGGVPFGLFKFRTMRPHSESQGKLTIGSRDPRITSVGYVLRKYKIDELPQLINVVLGHMSLVGPRPEVPEYTDMYNADQRRVLEVKPGITDYASLLYFHESELLARSANPRKTYIEEVMPAKLRLNLEYIERRSFKEDLRIIAKTISRILGTR